MDRETFAAGFVAGAAELREQLSLMSAASQLLERTAGSREVHYVAALNRSIFRMLRTVDRLELTHSLSGETPAVVREPVELSLWVEELGRRMQGVLSAAGIRLEWEAPPAGTLLGDRELLERMVLEMVTLAAENGDRLRFVLSCRGDRVHLTVRAEGEQPSRPLVPRCLAREMEDPGEALVRRVAGLHGGVMVTELEGERCRTLTVILPREGEQSAVCLESPRRSAGEGGFDPVMVAFSHLLPEEEFLLRSE